MVALWWSLDQLYLASKYELKQEHSVDSYQERIYLTSIFSERATVIEHTKMTGIEMAQMLLGHRYNYIGCSTWPQHEQHSRLLFGTRWGKPLVLWTYYRQRRNFYRRTIQSLFTRVCLRDWSNAGRSSVAAVFIGRRTIVHWNYRHRRYLPATRIWKDANEQHQEREVPWS